MPFPSILRGVERLEGVGDRLGRHADPAVAHDQLDLAVEAAHRDFHRAARGHRVAGVEREVRDHLLELAPVGADEAARHDRRRKLDAFAEEAREQALEPGDDFAQVEHLRRQHLPAAEGEQLARERGRSIGRAHDLERVFAARVVVVEACGQELAVAADRGQQIVEVVRDPARKPSDRLELLRVQQLFLQLALVGDIPVVDDHDPLAVLAAPAADRLDPAPGAVAVLQLELDRAGLLARQDRGERRLDVLEVVLVQQRKARPADELLGLPAEYALDRRALVEAGAVGGEDRDHVGCVLDQRPEQLLTAAQEGLGPVPLGHILADRGDPADCARLVVLERAAPRDVAALAGARPDRALEVRPDLALLQLLQEVGPDIGVVVEEVEPVVADDLLAAPAGQLEQEVVRERDGPVRIDPDPDEGDRLERLAMALIRLAQRPLRGELVGDVAEGPDAADDLAPEPLRCRVALDRPAVGQVEDVMGGDLPVLRGDLVHAADELIRVGHAVADAGDDGLAVGGLEQGLRDLPEIRERAVAGGDVVLQVGHEDRVGGRVERRLQQRVRVLTLGFGLLQRGDVERDGPDEGGLVRVVEHDRGVDAQPDQAPVGCAHPVLVAVVLPILERLRDLGLDHPLVFFVHVRAPAVVLDRLGWVAEDALGLLVDVRESLRTEVVLGHDRLDRAEELLEPIVGRLDRRARRCREGVTLSRHRLYTRKIDPSSASVAGRSPNRA